jgi:hypothetical protein
VTENQNREIPFVELMRAPDVGKLYHSATWLSTNVVLMRKRCLGERGTMHPLHGCPDSSAQRRLTEALPFGSKFQNWLTGHQLEIKPILSRRPTRTYPLSEKLPFRRDTNEMLSGLTGIGSMTSVSLTVRGTVSSMRERTEAQVELKRPGERASAFMVAFPSLEKIRASERVVMFAPTTRGFLVFPEM